MDANKCLLPWIKFKRTWNFFNSIKQDMYIAMHIEQYPADLFSRSPLISITGSKQSGKSDDINFKSKIDCQTWKALLSRSIL